MAIALLDPVNCSEIIITGIDVLETMLCLARYHQYIYLAGQSATKYGFHMKFGGKLHLNAYKTARFAYVVNINDCGAL